MTLWYSLLSLRLKVFSGYKKKLLVYGRLDHILKVYMFFMGHLLFTIPVALACIIKADLDPFHESCQQCSIITEAPPNQTKFLEIREKWEKHSFKYILLYFCLRFRNRIKINNYFWEWKLIIRYMSHSHNLDWCMSHALDELSESFFILYFGCSDCATK